MRRTSERRPDRLPEALWVGAFAHRARVRLGRPGGGEISPAGLANPPGRAELRYRVGTYSSFLADMLRHVEVQRIPDGPHRGAAPLAKLNVEEPANWVLALLHAWAVVGDVLSFYQERIVNEGYLATATEPLSLRELFHTIGYLPHPGAAAVTHLAFRASTARGMPEEVTLARGARVQSLPVSGRPVQLFETDEALSARAEWNRIEPRVPTVLRRPPLLAGSTGVKLAGIRSGLDHGASLLVVGTLQGVDGSGERRWWRTVEKTRRPFPSRGPRSTVHELLQARARKTGEKRSPFTEVSWGEPLDAGHGEAEVLAPQVFELRRRGSLFGHNAPEWSTLPLDQQRALRPIEGGVVMSGEDGGGWSQSNEGLPSKPIHALASSAGGVTFAATAIGLYRAVGSGPWEALEGLGRQPVQAVATDGQGTVWAATATGGVLRSGDGGDTWEPVTGHRPTGPLGRIAGRVLRRPPRLARLPRGPVHTLLAVPGLRGFRLLAGTDKGIYSSRDRGDGWQPLNRGLPGADPKTGLVGLAVHALAADSSGALWAGTGKGVFRARRPGGRWHAASRGLPGADPKTGLATTPVLALAAYDDRRSRRRRLAAATADGVFHRAGIRGTWRATGEGLPGIGPGARAAAALAVRTDSQTLTHELWAATAGGLFRSSDHGETWVPAGPDGDAAGATAVTVGVGGRVVAASPFGGFSEDEWPGFHLRGRTIDLSSVVSEIVPGGWVVLTESRDDGPPRVGIYRVESVATVRRKDFRLDALVTRVVVDHAEGLEAFDLRRTVVHSVSRELALWSEEVPLLEPLDPEEIEVDCLSSSLEAGRAVIVTGRPLRLTLAAGSPPATLQPREQGAPALSVGPGEVLTLTAPPPRWGECRGEHRGARTTLAVRHPDAGEGTLDIPVAAVRWLPAAEDVEPVAQLTRVAGFTHQTTSHRGPAREDVLVSLVVLDPPLVHGLDPATSALLANVARASQGETVVEHLSGGEVSRPHRSLVLAKTPLSWLPAATPDGVASTLEVRVGGSRWREIRSLREARSQDRVYVVRQDLQGRPHLVFGDDREGARLPRGHGNVEVTYRSGMWTDPLPAGHLSLLQTRPLGLQGVTNPLPVGGGTPAELLSEGRERAPQAARALGRIVSLSDCEDFVASFPGVARVHLARLRTDSGPLVQITVAGPGGKAVEGALLDGLVEAVAANRLPGPRVRIDSYRHVPVVVEARVHPAPDELAGLVEERLRAHLAVRLGFTGARFGQTLTASEVVTTIQEVPGVMEVELTAFHPAGAPPGVADALRAAPTTWSPSDAAGGTVLPAQLLILDESGGLRLEVFSTP